MCEFQGPQWKINKCFGHFVIQTSFPLCRGSMDQAPKKFFFDFFFLPIIRDSEDPEDLVLLKKLISRFVWVLPVHICVRIMYLKSPKVHGSSPDQNFFRFFFFTNYSGFGRSGRSRDIKKVDISLRLGSTRTHMCAHNVPEIPGGPWIKPRTKIFSDFFFLPIIRDSEDREDLVI